MTSQLFPLPVWSEVGAMMVAGAYGAAVARSRNVPIYGTFLAGVLAGLGGGMARDVLLGLQPVAISVWYYIPAVLVASVFGATLLYRVVREAMPHLIVQSVAFGLLISIGAQKAMVHGVPFFSIILCAVLTASTGGMVIDVLTGHRSAVMSQAHWFASALTVGALCYWSVSSYADPLLAVVGAMAVITALRTLSVLRNWPSPMWPGEGTNMSS